MPRTENGAIVRVFPVVGDLGGVLCGTAGDMPDILGLPPFWRVPWWWSAVVAAADPAVPPAEPNTLWHFLGIPQGCDKIKDAIKNKKGDCPCKERKPPLKRIADPANLDSQNPEIKAAAKIKAEEDLVPQKVKAIKYLASVGCGCYPGVRDALLACLGDCTEEVALPGGRRLVPGGRQSLQGVRAKRLL